MRRRVAAAFTVSSTLALAPVLGLAAASRAAEAPGAARHPQARVAPVRDTLPDLVMLPLTTCTDQKAHCQPLHVGRYVEGKGESPGTAARRTSRGHLVI